MPAVPTTAAVFISVLVAWNVLRVGFLLWQRHRRGLALPRPNGPDVVFSERFASGSSHKTWLTRLSGASNCLTVIVTRTHLAVTTLFPFAAFVGSSDLEHLVPLGDIVSVVRRGRFVDVAFTLPAGASPRKLTLRLRQSDDFLRALQPACPPPPLPVSPPQSPTL